MAVLSLSDFLLSTGVIYNYKRITAKSAQKSPFRLVSFLYTCFMNFALLAAVATKQPIRIKGVNNFQHLALL